MRGLRDDYPNESATLRLTPEIEVIALVMSDRVKDFEVIEEESLPLAIPQLLALPRSKHALADGKCAKGRHGVRQVGRRLTVLAELTLQGLDLSLVGEFALS